jgi:hypothetical protein
LIKIQEPLIPKEYSELFLQPEEFGDKVVEYYYQLACVMLPAKNGGYRRLKWGEDSYAGFLVSNRVRHDKDVTVIITYKYFMPISELPESLKKWLNHCGHTIYNFERNYLAENPFKG